MSTPGRVARVGRAGLAAIAVSIAGTVAVGAAGTSLMTPPLPGAPGWLPWGLELRLSPYLAVGLAAASLAAGALGLLLTLRAMRSGWTVSPRSVLLAGVIAAIAVGTTRPFGTSDFLSYAAYGHELVTGHNPYLVAPRALPGDPVARAVQDWAGTPSVYGALATGVFGAASLAAGVSARLTVFALDLVSAAAFVVTGVLLYRLARGRAARLRAALLWTCNPLLLQVLVAGSHVDGLAVAFSIGGLAVLFPVIQNGPVVPPGALRGAAAGTLLGLGCAVKPTAALMAIGLAMALVVAGKRLAAACLAAGFGVVAVTDLLVMGSAGIGQTTRASALVSVGSPWRVVRAVLSYLVAEPVANDVVRWCAVALAALLVVRFVPDFRRYDSVDQGQSAWRASGWAFLLVVAWLAAWPYVLPWYDALAWALLALLPASGFDWLLLARTAVLAFGYLPARATGITIPAGLRWMEPVLRSAITPAVLATLLVLLACRLPRCIRRSWGRAFPRSWLRHDWAMRYAYLGPPGTFTEAAVASLAGSPRPDEVEPVPYPSVGATLAAVRSGEAERGVVPVESSVEGIVTATVDDLTGTGDLLIRAETTLPIEFALLARPGTALDDVKTVGGHPQAEAQCRRWLTANLPGREWVPLASNAEAARRAAEGELDAALAGEFAAARYGLSPLAPAVHDRSNAVTRFLVVAPPGELPAPTGSDRTSLAAFLTEDHPGALMEILTEFAVRGVNLTTIQSRPTGDGLGSYFFFIDCEGHIDDARVGEAMMGVRRVCAEVRFLGSYPRSDGGRTQVRAGTSDSEFAEAAAWLGRLRYGRP